MRDPPKWLIMSPVQKPYTRDGVSKLALGADCNARGIGLGNYSKGTCRGKVGWIAGLARSRSVLRIVDVLPIIVVGLLHRRAMERHRVPARSAAEVYEDIRIAADLRERGKSAQAITEDPRFAVRKVSRQTVTKWLNAWDRLELDGRPLLLKALQELGSARVYHLAAHPNARAVYQDGRIEGERKTLVEMTETELRIAIGKRSTRARKSAKAGTTLGPTPEFERLIPKAIKAFLEVWDRVERVVDEHGVSKSAAAKCHPHVRNLAAVVERLKILVRLETR